MPVGALCLVVAIADGDTLTARCGEPGAYQQVKIRISAIDAPEKKQPFGQQSRNALSAICFHQQATVVAHGKDRYGRTIADVECKGLDVGQAQVASGMAWVYDKYAKGYESLYRLQNDAQTAKRGLWSSPSPIPPWDWRHKAK